MHAPDDKAPVARRRPSRDFMIALAIVFAVAVSVLAIGGGIAARQAWRRARTADNLEQLGRALENYSQRQGNQPATGSKP